MNDKQYDRLVAQCQAMAKLLGIPCLYLKKCTKVTAPADVALYDGYGVVGSDGLMGEVFTPAARATCPPWSRRIRSS